MPETTPHLDIALLQSNQSQKEITANAAFATLDALLNTAILDRDLTAPPGSPAEGDLYIPASTATGDWAGQEGKIAHYLNSAWAFITPREGLTLWVADEDQLITYDGTSWVTPTPQSFSLIGINTSADATNKLAAASDAVLFNHNGTDSRVKVNKNAASNTASHLFQTGFTGHAEFGLTGDNNFHVKVSPNGSTWYDALTVDSSNGHCVIEQEIRLGSTSGPLIVHGSGTPEGYVAAPVGSTFHRTDGGAGTSFYVKESSTGATGWVAK